MTASEKAPFGGIAVDREQYRDLVFGLFLKPYEFGRWLAGKPDIARPRPVHFCHRCKLAVTTTTLPQQCPYCKQGPSEIPVRLFLVRGETLLLPFFVETSRVAMLRKVCGQLLRGWV